MSDKNGIIQDKSESSKNGKRIIQLFAVKNFKYSVAVFAAHFKFFAVF